MLSTTKQAEEVVALRSVLTSHHKLLDATAEAWLASGAHLIELRSGSQVISRWYNGKSSAKRSFATEILHRRESVGELVVYGLEESDALVERLHADALVIARLLAVEEDISMMTDDLIEAQDQMLALYELTQSFRSQLTVKDVLSTLAEQVARLMKCEAVFAYFETEDKIEHIGFPEEHLHIVVVQQFYERLRSNAEPVILGPVVMHPPLPGFIQGILLEPIYVQGEICGVLGLLNKLGGNFNSPDLKLGRAIAEQVGAEIENVLLHEQTLRQARLNAEMELARKVQQQLLPRKAPKVAQFQLRGLSKPALRVGGDFYDFIRKNERSSYFFLGDVTGKGLSAALLMAIMRATLRMSTMQSGRFPTPKEIMHEVNTTLYDDFTEVSMFATTFVGHLDSEAGELSYANAGHSPVIFCPVDGEPHLLEADGTAIGVLPESFCETHTLSMKPGDVLVAATDGFSEARDPDNNLFGYERLNALVGTLTHYSADEIVERLIEAIADFSQSTEQDDDQTLVVIKYVGANS